MNISSLDLITALSVFSLNNTVSESVGTHVELADSIRKHLEQDDAIRPYLPYLRDPAEPRDADITEFLQNYSLSSEGLVLKDGLIYIPTADEIKVKIL
jgi:hypothetical protein